MSEKREKSKKVEKKAKNNITRRKKTVKAIVGLVAIIMLIVVGIVLITNINSKKDNENGTQQVENEEKTNKDEYVSEGEGGIRVNISKKIKEEKEIDGLKITDMEITEVDNVSTIVANVKNETKEDKGEYAIEIKLVDKERKEITRIAGYIGKIKAGESMALTTSATYDFANAYDCEIIKK